MKVRILVRRKAILRNKKRVFQRLSVQWPTRSSRHDEVHQSCRRVSLLKRSEKVVCGGIQARS
jgi:hypothetical protein